MRIRATLQESNIKMQQQQQDAKATARCKQQVQL
jgi:hypothetical protein